MNKVAYSPWEDLTTMNKIVVITAMQVLLTTFEGPIAEAMRRKKQQELERLQAMQQVEQA